MDLEQIELDGLGMFTEERAGFRVDKFHLEEPWSYIYTTDKILLKLDQHGPDYAQFSPPAGTVLSKRERFQTWPSWFVWVKTAEGRAFTNFYHPVVGMSPTAEPEEFSCRYAPEKAVYTVTQDSVRCTTTLLVPEGDAVVLMACSFENLARETKQIELIPVMRPHLASANLEVWDIPSLYQIINYAKEDRPLFSLTLRDPGGDPDRREHAFLVTDFPDPDGVEVDYARFVGRGTFESPEALHAANMAASADGEPAPTRQPLANTVDSRQGIAALSKTIWLQPGARFEFTMVTGAPEVASRGSGPTTDELGPYFRYLDADEQARSTDARRAKLEEFMGLRSIETPDKAFDRYVNEWLPLQLGWVGILDRGWPSGMRGTRDCAQDTTAFVPLDSDYCRKTILFVMQMQRSDGWFPRQFSVHGRQGRHDHRNYVDGGAWVWQLLYDYLCWTKDFGILSEPAQWLDDDLAGSVLDHAWRSIDYYTKPANLGEHGLCKIREGDWNDSVNRAGLEGRGESVMVTCQVVMMLKQAARLCEFLAGVPVTGLRSEDMEQSAHQYAGKAEELTQNLLDHALNDQGYLNGVFTDNGEWVFSPCDPDGKRRVNVPVNAFGMISGVLQGERFQRALEVLVSLKTRDGWPLYWPGIGDPPIEKLGRVGKGDVTPGNVENAGIYNHGCHGFFARGVARSGHGDLALEILRCMLPYDQDRHPVSRAKSAPYGVPNHWKLQAGVEGRGGACFLSGSIATALGSVYGGLFGIQPQLEGLAIDPDLPSEFTEAKVRFSYRGAEVRVVYKRGIADVNTPRLMINGEPVTTKIRDVLLDKEVLVIPHGVFESANRCEVSWEE